MEIVWRRSALNDLEALREFIAQDNPRAAARIYAAIQAAVERLAAYPNLGRAGRVEGTRELIPNPVDRNLCCGCHCERSEAISSGNAHPDRDCFVAPLLAMTGRAWILIIRIWYQMEKAPAKLRENPAIARRGNDPTNEPSPTQPFGLGPPSPAVRERVLSGERQVKVTPV